MNRFLQNIFQYERDLRLGVEPTQLLGWQVFHFVVIWRVLQKTCKDKGGSNSFRDVKFVSVNVKLDLVPSVKLQPDFKLC